MNNSKEERLKELTHMQFEVTQNGATERPFRGEYVNNNMLTPPFLYML